MSFCMYFHIPVFTPKTLTTFWSKVWSTTIIMMMSSINEKKNTTSLLAKIILKILKNLSVLNFLKTFKTSLKPLQKTLSTQVFVDFLPLLLFGFLLLCFGQNSKKEVMSLFITNKKFCWFAESFLSRW